MTGPGRYAATATAMLTTSDGRQVPYLRRRFLPPPESVAVRGTRTVAPGDRGDLLAALELGDPDQAWRIGDANGVLRLRELEEPGRELRMPFPGGIAGAVAVPDPSPTTAIAFPGGVLDVR